MITESGPQHLGVVVSGPASAGWPRPTRLEAVVRTGASAIQFVPAIQPRAGRITVVQRTPPSPAAAGAAAGVWWLARFRVRRRVVGQAPVRARCGDVVSVASSAATLASWSSACRLARRGSHSPAIRKMSGMNRTWPPTAIQK